MSEDASREMGEVPKTRTLQKKDYPDWEELFEATPLERMYFPNEEQQRVVMEGMKHFMRMVLTCRPDTIVFLDKSARPVSWMFNQMWSELKKVDLIPTEAERPEVRYVNVGYESKDKHEDPQKLREAKKKYRSERDGLILLVDERAQTGKSLEKAAEVVSYLWPTRTLVSHGAFEKDPFWYWTYPHLKAALFGIYDDKDFDSKRGYSELTAEKYQPDVERRKLFKQLINDIASVALTELREEGISAELPQVPRQSRLHDRNSQTLRRLGVSTSV